MDAHRLVQVRCQCELGKGVSIVVTDRGQGFDPKTVPDPLAVERLEEEHGRGLHLMKLAMDEVSFGEEALRFICGRVRLATQEQISRATTKPSTAALWTAFGPALSLRLPRRMRVADMRGRRC